MSLLNEALRKNRFEERQKVAFNAPSKAAEISGKVLILIVLFIGFAAGLTYLWIMNGHNTVASQDIIPVARSKDNMLTPVPVALPAMSATETIAVEEPVAMLSAVKDNTPEIKFQENPVKETVRDEPKLDIAPEKGAGQEKIPDIIVAQKEEDADSYLKKAKDLHRQARYEMALTMYKKALGIDCANPEVLFNMASIYITVNRYQDAYGILSGLVSSDKHDPKVMLNLAVTEIGLNKYEDALSHLSTLDGDDPELLFEISFHRGIALSRMGRSDDAIKSYEEAEKIKSNHPALLLNMAVLYDRYGRYREAIDYYTRLINSESSRHGKTGVYKNRIEQLSAHLSGSGENGSGK
jgi:tetratricopeptide (TPR) repeat protein